MNRTYFVFLSLSFLILAGCGTHEEAPVKPQVEVKVARAEIASVSISVTAPAAVTARELANVGARIVAPIRKLLVRKGDQVTAGQVMAELEDRDLAAQRDEAAAAVADARANLDRVSSATLPTEIERARGQLTSAEAALNQARKFSERREQLFKQGAIPQRDLVLSQTELAQAKANFDVAKKSLDLMENQSRAKDIQMARSRLDQAEARLASVKTQLGFAAIRSPFAGTVTEQFLFPGDMAKPDAPIFTVMDLSVAVARAQVPEAEAGALRVGQACRFTPSDNAAVSFDGRVTVVNQAVDPARRTVETWCEILNPRRALRGGVFGSARIVTGVAAKSVVVPLAAVQFIEGTRKGSVMLIGAKNAAVKKEVETGEIFDGKVQIKAGLSGGESVIVEGGYGLPEGAEVRLREAK